jgi:hypothetical protein
MPSFRPRVRWHRARAILVSLLLPALTLGGVPVGASCCGFGCGACRCSGDNGLDRSAAGRVALDAAAPSPNKVRPCCRLGQGHCPGCCAQFRSKQSRSSSGPNSVVAGRPGQAADCSGRVPTRGEHLPATRCCCVPRGDLDVPKQAGPFYGPVSERAVHEHSGFPRIDPCLADDFGSRWNSVLGPSCRADRVIDLCRLLI